ncbi:MAG: peptide deformylase [Gammaproteobacteria bacterium]|nr:peptide deformylase [Gammaproteobacteria bacterium]
MALRTIIYLSDERLRKPTQPITVFDDPLQTLIDDMYETMYHAPGIGLAATQIGLSLKLAVIDVSEEHNQRICIINPEIISREGTALPGEGCLSVPGVFDKVARALKVTVRALDRHGKPFELKADGLLAHCLQHEIDHLNGKIFIDYLSPLKRGMAKKKFEKFIRHEK